MTVHRPAWERVFTIRAWTKGQDRTLFHIIAPPRDKGNGTLKRGREMWIFNPKVNRVIKIPPSMMSQAWMGSDFSNDDLAKTDSLIKDYTHRLAGSETHEGKKVFIIESIPKPAAPVVWGMQRLKIREDHILLEEIFFDEDRKPVKTMSAHQIEMIDGRLFPRIWKMRKSDAQDKYTRLKYDELKFDTRISDSVFTLTSLKNPKMR
jgi:outer membrane lipoprotein-sorting protein